MGLFDQVVGNLAASALGGKGNEGGIIELVLPLLNKYPGGIAGLVQAFQQGGLGEIVNSWISTGKNLPVTTPKIYRLYFSIILPAAVPAPQRQSSRTCDVYEPEKERDRRQS